MSDSNSVTASVAIYQILRSPRICLVILEVRGHGTARYGGASRKERLTAFILPPMKTVRKVWYPVAATFRAGESGLGDTADRNPSSKETTPEEQ